MKLLAIDTATEACSVALYLEGEVEERFEVIPRQHTERVLPMVDDLLQQAGLSLSELDAIAFDQGPGSFTGVRVGTSVAQGLAFSNALPVIAISSLAALAWQAWRLHGQQQVLACIDARMGEIYWGCYQFAGNQMQLVGREQVSKASAIEAAGDWFCLGSGHDQYQTVLQQQQGVCRCGHMIGALPHAQDIAVLAAAKRQTCQPDQAIPSYIRNEVTWKKLSEQ